LSGGRRAFSLRRAGNGSYVAINRAPPAAGLGPKPVIYDLLGVVPHLSGGLIKSQAEECGVPQAVFGRPFHESDLRHQLRLRPVHLVHLISCDTCAPSPDISVRKIGKRAVLNLQWFQLAENLSANVPD